MMYPKPKIKKHRAKNNPKPTANSICEVCGKPYSETHEIFFGIHRQLSIQYGLQVCLCLEHHRGPNGPHHNRDRDLELKQRGQRFFEHCHGRQRFMELFGRNYL